MFKYPKWLLAWSSNVFENDDSSLPPAGQIYELHIFGEF